MVADRRCGVLDIDNPILAFVFSHVFHLLPAQPSVQKSAALFASPLKTELILDQGMYPRELVRRNNEVVLCLFM